MLPTQYTGSRRTGPSSGDEVPRQPQGDIDQPQHPAVVDAQPRGHRSRRAAAQRVSSWRLDSWSLRSTAETWVSTVLIEMNSSEATSR